MANAVLRKVAEYEGWADLPIQRLPGWLRRRLKAIWGEDAVLAIEAAHHAGGTVDLTLKPGLAAPEGGEPVAGSWRMPAGVQVSAFPDFRSGTGGDPMQFRLRGMPQELTNAGGEFKIVGLAPGAYNVRASRSAGNRGRMFGIDGEKAQTGTTNLRIKTANNYSPHLYPEYITDIEYYYGAAPRPGFMGRFIVGESNVRAPYWAVSPNSFGGQVGASPNGDAPGDIYRLLGGVVLRRAGTAPMYSGYILSLIHI